MNSKSLRPLVVVGALVLSGLMATYAYAGLKKPPTPVGTGPKGTKLEYQITATPASIGNKCPSSSTSCTVSFSWTTGTGNPTTDFVIRREGKIAAVAPKGKKGESWDFVIDETQPNSWEQPEADHSFSDTITTVKGKNKKGTKTCSVAESANCTIYLTYKVRAINDDPAKEEPALSKGALSTEQFKLGSGALTSVVGG